MKKKILVVEDIASIRQFVCDTLKRKGYDTLDAPNGQEAYRILEQSDSGIDLVLTDYNMPNGSGFELLQMIKANDRVSKVPVVFLTTESNPELIRNAKEAGLAAWVKKPYKAHHFYGQLEALLHQ